MIPKLAFTYWEGKQFSPLHLLTVQTFCHHNPDVSIIIYYDTQEFSTHWKSHEHKEHIHELSDIHQLKELKNVSFEQVSNIPKNKPIVVADYIRVVKLHEHGGMWIDFDIFFINKIPDEMWNQTEDIGIFTYHGVIATGLMTSQKGGFFCSKLITNMNARLSDSGDDYQHIGPNMWTQVYYEHVGNSVWHSLQPHRNKPVSVANTIVYPNAFVYPYLWNELEKLYVGAGEERCSQNTFGIHWYNGATLSKQFINAFFQNPDEFSTNVFAKRIRSFNELK